MKPVKVDNTIFQRINLTDYIMEKKYDGYRITLEKDKCVKIYTRHKNRLEIPNSLIRKIEELEIPSGTVLDGEIWNLCRRGAWNYSKNDECQMTFWDVTHYEFKDLSSQSLEKRRGVLESMIRPGSYISTTEVYKADVNIFQHIRKEALDHRNTNNSNTGFIHGVVLKRKGSQRRDLPKASKEHPDWLKIVFF